MGIQEILPKIGETTIDIPAQPVGSLRFTCGMGMYGGAIEFRDVSAAHEAGTSQSRPAPNRGDPGFIGPVLPTQAALAAAPIRSDADAQVVTITVSDYGYEPPVVRAKANMPIKLVLQTQGAYG